MPDVPLPFEDADVQTAFPNYQIHVPMLGRGTFKVAYRFSGEAPSDYVLKILTDPVALEVDGQEVDVGTLPERLARELAGMSLVSSPHLAQMVAAPVVTDINGGRFIVYEERYYGGGTLEDRLAGGPLDADQTEALVIALLLAVQALWQEGIVHRDIKPANIVFDDANTPVLIDLGIALHTGLSDLTESYDESPKTPIYAAPEQFGARRYAEIDVRTDQFLIGIVGYQALTGVHPFRTPDITRREQYIHKLLTFENVDSSLLNCSPELQAVLIRMLAPKPNRRFRTIEEPLRVLVKE
ncbi:MULTISPECIES: serine/threonine-protein kinase [unclassified Rathayibacter]|uniref:serine/threonine-protein kinase n=1 Tax=unclassified Rathayibacter TaxID=2609250 RepID=UPI00104FA83B|nr:MULTISPECIES: serine/threonine-protein kinase [unclassified Rathayibacter]TCL80158.1 serine/threonine protein kinase [Rathayibacter sp. PhB192]TCM25599.1 serine/threonine protein kinase [Rathayibacter sp. PhB179]